MSSCFHSFIAFCFFPCPWQSPRSESKPVQPHQESQCVLPATVPQPDPVKEKKKKHLHVNPRIFWRPWTYCRGKIDCRWSSNRLDCCLTVLKAFGCASEHQGIESESRTYQPASHHPNNLVDKSNINDRKWYAIHGNKSNTHKEGLESAVFSSRRRQSRSDMANFAESPAKAAKNPAHDAWLTPADNIGENLQWKNESDELVINCSA